jgi:endonuclease/exonuclease/phosphatase family metal-dependent hydrolase
VKYFNFIVAIILTIIYAVGKIPPSEQYNLWIITFIIPFALAANIILLLVSLMLRKKSSLYYIVTLIIGSNYLVSTIGIKNIFNNSKITKETFSVLSYNVKALADHYSAPSAFVNVSQETLDLKNWLMNHEAEIQCYQEFINFEGNDDFDLVKMFNDKGYHTYFSYDSSKAFRSVVVGTLITSKFPIVRSGDVVASENGFNRITYADIKMDMDTLRIVNVHLESMGLKKYHPLQPSGLQSRKENTKMILHKLKEGVFERSRQIKILAHFIESSPYPVICAGDFNDMPYSYSYQFMKRRMKNAFEEVGTGLGFTYNGKTLRVLRIDNQFYSSDVSAVRFETLNQIKFTDHFPLLGLYKLSP